MRQLEVTGARSAEWREAPDARLQGDGEAIVRPLAVALCDLDAGFLAGLVPIGEPFPLGHECVGEVVDHGNAVTSVRRGDRVVVPFQISCGHCGACRAGFTGSCETAGPGSAYGMRPLGGDWGGALADLIRVPFADAMLVRVPDGVDPTAIPSVADNVPDGFRAVAGPLRDAPAADVLVAGGLSRSVSLYAVLAARALGAGRVVYADHDEGRLAAAAALGAETAPIPLDDGGSPRWPGKLGRFPITVDGTGDRAGLHTTIASTAANGRCTSVAIYFEPETPLPLLAMYTRGCTFHTSRVHARSLVPTVLEHVVDGSLDPSLVTSAVVRFDDAPDALVDPPTKLVLVP
jgi:threonine dehydrogenase-like Zn-dependent dehydrogenase